MERGVSRRAVLAMSGAAVATTIAGCVGDDDGASPEDWEGVSRIELDGHRLGWDGLAPDVIEGETNPTLVLFEGEDYEIEWYNADNVPHDLVLYDADGNVVDDLATETINSEGESATLEFTASGELDEYICTLHPRQMVGGVDVE